MDNNELTRKKNKFEIIALVVGIAIIVTALAGITYSFFAVGIDREGEHDPNRIVAGDLDIDFVTGTAINNTEFFPIDGSTDTLFKANATTDGNKLTFSVGNTKANSADRTLRYRVYLTVSKLDNPLRTQDFKWQLWQGTNDWRGDFGSFTATTEYDIPLTPNIEIPRGDTHDYEFYLALVGRTIIYNPSAGDQRPDIFNSGEINARIKILVTL